MAQKFKFLQNSCIAKWFHETELQGIYLKKYGRKSCNLVKSHEVISHFIKGYLVPQPPYYRFLLLFSDWSNSVLFFQVTYKTRSSNLRSPKALSTINSILWKNRWKIILIPSTENSVGQFIFLISSSRHIFTKFPNLNLRFFLFPPNTYFAIF